MAPIGPHVSDAPGEQSSAGLGAELTSRVRTGTIQATGPIGVNGNTPVGKQTGGVATAAGTYGANEQQMLQRAYDALRAVGILA